MHPGEACVERDHLRKVLQETQRAQSAISNCAASVSTSLCTGYAKAVRHRPLDVRFAL
jgi:hypothetical protein